MEWSTRLEFLRRSETFVKEATFFNSYCSIPNTRLSIAYSVLYFTRHNLQPFLQLCPIP